LARDDSIGKVIEEIGTGKACFTQSNIDDLRELLLKQGYDAAEGRAAQMMGTDGYTDLIRAIQIMRNHNLSTEAGADILRDLFQIRAGHF